MKKKLVIGAIALLVLVSGWFYASPLWTLKTMRDAAEARDATALAKHVDFDALKKDLKADFNARFGADIAKEQSKMGAFGALLGGTLVDSLIDRLVSPEGLSAMLAFDKAKAVGAAANPTPETSKEPGYKISRTGLSSFEVTLDEKRGKFLFARDGLSWKLVGIDLPEDFTGSKPGKPL